MDDARFWMWEKQRGVHGLTMRGSGHNLNTDAQATPHSSYDVSWVERAFAEDAAGPLGGCIWPPRSYSCNFCGREFRSAQALGGHMNVHRRDRARLKQSSLSPQDVFDHHQPSQQLQQGSLSKKSLHVASQECDLAYSPNPNPNPVGFNMTAPTSLALKISSPSATRHISIDQESTFFPLGIREGKRPWSKNTVADQNIQTSDLKMDADKRGPQILKYLGEGGLMHCDKPDISLSLNLFLFQTQARKKSKNESAGVDDQDGGGGGYNTGSKRRKLKADESSTMSSSYTKSSIIIDRVDEYQKLSPAQRSSSFIHALDLELRLGEQPEVK